MKYIFRYIIIKTRNLIGKNNFNKFFILTLYKNIIKAYIIASNNKFPNIYELNLVNKIKYNFINYILFI